MKEFAQTRVCNIEKNAKVGVAQFWSFLNEYAERQLGGLRYKNDTVILTRESCVAKDLYREN
jgi:hypothetical protein